MEANRRVQQFRDLLVWPHSMGLAEQVYAATAPLPKEGLYGQELEYLPEVTAVPLLEDPEGIGRMVNGLLNAGETKLHSELRTLDSSGHA